MNHFDILAKTINKLKKEQQNQTPDEKDIKQWVKIMHDLYTLCKYGESLYDKPMIMVPVFDDPECMIVLEDISSNPNQNLIFKVSKGEKPTGCAISEDAPLAIHKIDPNATARDATFLPSFILEISERWVPELKEKTEAYLKSQMQNYVRAHMDI